MGHYDNLFNNLSYWMDIMKLDKRSFLYGSIFGLSIIPVTIIFNLDHHLPILFNKLWEITGNLWDQVWPIFRDFLGA